MMTTWTDELAVDLPDGDQICVDVTCRGTATYDSGGGDYAPCWDYDATCVEFTVQEDAEITAHYKDTLAGLIDAAIVTYLESPDEWPWIRDYDDRDGEY